MERFLIAGVLVALAIGIALVLRRRGIDAPTQTSWAVPSQLDPADLAQPGEPAPPLEGWTLVTFTSATCNSCADVRRDAATLAGADRVRVVDIEVGRRPDLHQRYGVDAVPMLLATDSAGLVRASVVGPLHDDDLQRLATLCASPPGPALDDGTPVDFA